MRPTRLGTPVVVGAVVLAWAAPARSTSLATCTTSDFSGLPATWSTPQHVQMHADLRWQTANGRLERVPAEDWRGEGLDDVSVGFVAFPSADRGFVAGYPDNALRTTDGGAHWARMRIPDAENLGHITCTDEDLCWMVDSPRNEASRVLRTSDGGTTWRPSRTLIPVGLSDLFFLTPDLGWAVGGDGAFLSTRDGGETWEQRTLRLDGEKAPAPDLELVRFLDPRLGFLAAGHRLARTSDGGRSWTVVLTLGEGLSFFAIAPGDGELVAAVNGSCATFQEKGANHRSTDDGASWTEVIDPGEAEHDWEAFVQGTPDGRMSAVYSSRARGGPRDEVAILEMARGERSGSVERQVSAARRSPCGDVTVHASTVAIDTDLDDWVGADLCRIDPKAVREVFGELDESAPEVVVLCRSGARVFRVPWYAPFRQLERVSASLLALARTASRLSPTFPLFPGDSPLRRAEGARVAPLLRSGRYDELPETAAALRRILPDYDPALPPMGTERRIEVELPKGYRLAGEHAVNYPDIAAQARVSGTVEVELSIDPATGLAERVAVLKSVPLLDAAVVHAVPGWMVVGPPPAFGLVRVRVNFITDRCVRGGRVEWDR